MTCARFQLNLHCQDIASESFFSYRLRDANSLYFLTAILYTWGDLKKVSELRLFKTPNKLNSVL